MFKNARPNVQGGLKLSKHNFSTIKKNWENCGFTNIGGSLKVTKHVFSTENCWENVLC